MNGIKKIAEDIYRAEINKKPIPPIRTSFDGEKNINAAYKIQKLVTEKKIADGAKIIGKKIGLTSIAVQEQLGVDQPDFGVLTEQMNVPNHGEIEFNELMQPKAEAEWAFILKEDLDFEDLNTEKVIKAIDYALVAIEIVGSRIENWNIKITDTIADNASASHFVLGTQKINLSDVDLEKSKMRMFKNDLLVSEGTGEACMGNPLNAVLWLAQTMQKMGTPLLSGEIILSGALGPMVELSKGDFISTQINGFNEVHFYVI